MAREAYYRHGTGPTEPAKPAISSAKQEKAKKQPRNLRGRFIYAWWKKFPLYQLYAFLFGIAVATVAFIVRYPAIEASTVCLTEDVGRAELAALFLEADLDVVDCNSNPSIRASVIVVPPRPGVTEELTFNLVLTGRVQQDIPTPQDVGWSRVAYKGPFEQAKSDEMIEKGVHALLFPLRSYYVRKIREAVYPHTNL